MTGPKRKVSAPVTRVESPTDFWIVIPGPQCLTPAEHAAIEAGGEWPTYRVDHLPEQEALVDFLIERSVETWTRSRG